MRQIQVKINGKNLKIDVDKVLGALETSGPEIRGRISAEEAWYHQVWAAAEAEVERLVLLGDHYLNLGLRKLLEADPKIGEWKAKAIIKADDAYLKYQKEVIDARENSRRAQGLSEAFRRKSDVLRALIPAEVAQRYHSGAIGQKKGDGDGDDRYKALKQRRKRGS